MHWLIRVGDPLGGVLHQILCPERLELELSFRPSGPELGFPLVLEVLFAEVRDRGCVGTSVVGDQVVRGSGSRELWEGVFLANEDV